jgi:hypothetical protein
MPILGFTRLLDKLRDESKKQTIRKPRKHPLKVGDILHIFWKLRTKQCQKLGEAEVTKIERKRFKEISEGDAMRDGFPGGLLDFQREFVKMHPDVLYTDSLGNIQERYPYEGFDIITFEWTKKSPFFFWVK